jgi:putative peptidoglycan lipid II flippase
VVRRAADLAFKRQSDILSAAFLLAASTFLSRILGLVRDRILAHFFSPGEISLYFAAFRLPDTLFELLILGTLSAAFIPTFVSYISKKKEEEAWEVAAVVMNLAFLFFLLLAGIVFAFSHPFSRLVAPGFSPGEISLMASLTRLLLIPQGFFILSLFLTGILKSFQRFLIPAVAPLFYNLGIILVTFFFSESLGIHAPVWGALIGASAYFISHLPLAFKLGFRLRFRFNYSHPGVRKVFRLAAPRTLEIGFWQLLKLADLFFTSLISTASYAYLTFASHLALIPVSLFGASLADASLPTLSYTQENLPRFKAIFLKLLKQVIFPVGFFSIALVVLRIPAVRLAFGAARFTWESTVLTGYTLSAFSLGILGQAVTALVVRAFYALSDTLTPLKVGVTAVVLNIILLAFFVVVLKAPVWGVALAFAIASTLRMLVLGVVLMRRVGIAFWEVAVPFLKVGVASFLSGGSMYVLLKILDRSAWDRRLSFLGYFSLPERFENFVLDTRYTANLIVLTLIVGLVGLSIYLVAAKLLKIEELGLVSSLPRRLYRALSRRRVKIPPPQSSGEEEQLV